MFKNRPISPHVTAFNLGWTGTLSILHRITGIMLTLYLLMIVFTFKYITFHMSSYSVYCLGYNLNGMKGLLFSTIGLVLCISFAFHLFNGIRHLVWDYGYGFEIDKTQQSAYLVSGLAIILGFLLWIIL